MATRGKSKALADFLARSNPPAITEEIWRELAALLAPISESYLRRLLHATGLPIAQPFGGVRQGSLEELESSLIEIGRVYLSEPLACRRAVIQAKDHARLVSRNQKVDPEKRSQKEEMVEWMLVWLENPAIFETWVALRKRAMACPQSPG
jgi:hypothetical protein